MRLCIRRTWYGRKYLDKFYPGIFSRNIDFVLGEYKLVEGLSTNFIPEYLAENSILY